MYYIRGLGRSDKVFWLQILSISVAIMKKASPLLQPPKPLRLDKHFSAPALLGQIREDFGKIPDHRQGGQQFSLPDVLMSGLAVFGLKYPSLLKFDEQRHEERTRANLKSL